MTDTNERRYEHMNMIEFALCAEDRNRLDAILAELQKLNQANGQQKITLHPDQRVTFERVAPTPEATQEEAPKAEPVQTPAEEVRFWDTTLEAPEAKEEPKAPTVSVAELQAKVVELVSAGKRDEAKAVVNEYAERVSDIPEDKRHEVMQKLAALEV